MKYLLIIFVFLNLNTSFCEIVQNTNDNRIITKKSGIKIPLYEYSSPFWRDYRVNQSIRQSIRWGSIGTGIGVMSFLASDSEDSKIYSILLAGGLGAGGFIGGFISGYFTGVKYNSQKLNDPSFHTSKYSFGQEFAFSHSTFLDKEISSRVTPKYSFTFQTFHQQKFILSEYRISLSGETISFKNSNLLIEPRSFSFDILFNSNNDYLNYYFGLGVGYSEGSLTDEDSIIPFKKKVSGIIFYPISGVSVNFNDFFYLRVEGQYLLSQLYYKLEDYYDGELQKGAFNIGFTFGTYLF